MQVYFYTVTKKISIHALQAESDLRLLRASWLVSRYFNPRSPSGERLCLKDTCQFDKLFQSTLSKRRATFSKDANNTNSKISIHALQAESDSLLRCSYCIKINFNPRSPSGERLKASALVACLDNFNPRSPSGERRRYTFRHCC